MRLMKVIKLILLASVLTLGMATVCAKNLQADTSAKEVNKIEINDDTITAAIENKLRLDESIPEHRLDVKTRNGVVTLTGSVSHLMARDRAENIVETIKGVRSIVNLIHVNPVLRSDRTIRQDISNALAMDPATDSYEVKTLVKNGIATIRGKVDSWAEKQLITEVVKSVKGVRKINNDVNITFKSVRPDHEIKADIYRRLEIDPYVYSKLIDINVVDGKVFLSGSVGSLSEISIAANDARVVGVKEVDTSDLNVEYWMEDHLKRKNKWVAKTDNQIKLAISDALAYDPRVKFFNIDVRVKNGIVTLEGEVDHLKAKQAAESDAQNTTGVYAVINRINVDPKKVAKDNEIEKRLASALSWDPVVERHTISVDVQNGYAYLYGTVDTNYDKWRASDLASRVYGVVHVDNNIRVRTPWKKQPDQKIKDEIESQLFWGWMVESDEIDVKVNDGVAVLSGTVDSKQEMEFAIKNAYQGGARKVESQLRLQGKPRHDPYYGYMEYRFDWY